VDRTENDNSTPSGFLIVNKPSGPTSHDIIDQLRRITGLKKIGHAGTLDPFASGVLIVAVGREATRRISGYVKLDKEYEAVLRLGAVSDTYDRTGEIKKTSDVSQDVGRLNRDQIENVLKKFTGKQKQTPPMYSAKKVGGKKLYELARKGVEIDRQPAEITIYELKLLFYKWPLIKIKVRSSSGTYIRTLAHDIGQTLGYSAYLEELVRTAVGEFGIDGAVDLSRLNSGDWQEFLMV
jgi:tRNA pseudouridine55 synthase